MSRSEDRGQKLEVRSQGTKNIVLFVACCLSSFLFFLSSAASAQDDMLKIIETKRIELKEKEDQLKREEQRLNTLKKAVDEKIETYTKLLSQVEATIKKVEDRKSVV